MKPKNRQTQKIIKRGYEYTIIEGGDRTMSKHPEPCIFGRQNWALKSCKKLQQS